MKRRTPTPTTMTAATSEISKTATSTTAAVINKASSTMKMYSQQTNFYENKSVGSPVRLRYNSQVSLGSNITVEGDQEHTDELNYVLLIALYTLQGIPMGLSASIPFLIQQKIRTLAMSTAHHLAEAATSDGAVAAALTNSASAVAARSSYNANAIFALCSWPFSLKLLWAPIVDSCFLRRFGRRKSWIVPVQSLAGILMVTGANFVERQLGLGVSHTIGESINVKGVTAFFFILYFLMATQDIAVDGWALTMLSKKNRGRGPICNSIGQNIGYFLSFVGFLALNDVESSEMLWRPLLGLKSNPENGLVSLGSFIRSMGYFMLVVTTVVAFLKRETIASPTIREGYLEQSQYKKKLDDDDDNNVELDAAEIGLRETYHRLWAVCKLPAVQWLFLLLLTYRLPTSLGDNVKFLKAVEYGLSKSTTAVCFVYWLQLLSPTVILPLGIIVPILATRIWHNSPLQQFMTAFKLRVTLVPILDVMMLLAVRGGKPNSMSGLSSYWSIIILSTALQAIVSSMQFNAQMTFFAKRVDPAIGGSYMTLLNTAANLGGTWPASFVMWLMGILSNDPVCSTDIESGIETCTKGLDPFFYLQFVFSLLGVVWIFALGKRVRYIERLPDEAWRTHVLDNKKGGDEESLLSSMDVELEPSETSNRRR